MFIITKRSWPFKISIWKRIPRCAEKIMVRIENELCFERQKTNFCYPFFGNEIFGCQNREKCCPKSTFLGTVALFLSFCAILYAFQNLNAQNGSSFWCTWDSCDTPVGPAGDSRLESHSDTFLSADGCWLGRARVFALASWCPTIRSMSGDNVLSI